MSKHHDLKCDPAPFAEVKAGRKLSEIRLNDRDYQSGDTVTMREYDRDAGQYTGDTCGPFTIGHILREGYGLPEGFVMFSLLRPHPATPEVVREALGHPGIEVAFDLIKTHRHKPGFESAATALHALLSLRALASHVRAQSGKVGEWEYHRLIPCCMRDRNRDGVCDQHPQGVFVRRSTPPKESAT